MRYIVVWRRSNASRYLDVQLDGDGKIAVFNEDDAAASRIPVITDEQELVEYVNGHETEVRRVEAGLAHRILGWDIPA